MFTASKMLWEVRQGAASRMLEAGRQCVLPVGCLEQEGSVCCQ